MRCRNGNCARERRKNNVLIVIALPAFLLAICRSNSPKVREPSETPWPTFFSVKCRTTEFDGLSFPSLRLRDRRECHVVPKMHYFNSLQIRRDNFSRAEHTSVLIKVNHTADAANQPFVYSLTHTVYPSFNRNSDVCFFIKCWNWFITKKINLKFLSTYIYINFDYWVVNVSSGYVYPCLYNRM